ncbi:hypothetical protein PMAYCL1PPCAC_16205 [Pristionchus mayeri]|uniref:Uncharacterized protein n=1 Tax=Pristionchus mayeri TaxID=1317129 RepID=A0AAN5CKB2_9BILA|nr:hypothetical protein PMAYCL1PPCAC_16205 [Pristionchus mayeri]
MRFLFRQPVEANFPKDSSPHGQRTHSTPGHLVCTTSVARQFMKSGAIQPFSLVHFPVAGSQLKSPSTVNRAESRAYCFLEEIFVRSHIEYCVNCSSIHFQWQFAT